MIPFVRQIDFRYGEPDQVSPLIRRVIADNPGPFTFKGTGTYIVGRGEVAVIDPGPMDADHLEALLKATQGERVAVILVTHDHADHAPLADGLAKATGARIIGCEPHPDRQAPPQGVEEGLDRVYRPDRTPADGELIAGPGWTLRTLPTPGHTANHLCFALEEENALFTGDHVMGWSTTVVIPPDGDMTDYYASLERVKAGGFATLWPTHGPPITDPGPFLDAYLAHRRRREAQILGVLGRGPAMIDSLVGEMYVGLDKRLQRAAAASVLAHLLHLVKTGQVVSDGHPGLESEFHLAE
ncbi:MAG: hydroxyacylglutathione hydrolase [Caulobacteraceae bacterium]|nr:hydroxyacylglutathione hydrolase [Caulobacteraceae bacterium]